MPCADRAVARRIPESTDPRSTPGPSLPGLTSKVMKQGPRRITPANVRPSARTDGRRRRRPCSKRALGPALGELLIADGGDGGDVDCQAVRRGIARIARRASKTPWDDVTATASSDPFDPRHDGVQDDIVTELVGYFWRSVGFPPELVLLGAADDVEHPVQTARRLLPAGVQHHRDIVGFGAPAGHARHDRHQVVGGGRGFD